MKAAPSSADSRLLSLLGRCKCGVFLTVNEHRDYYQNAAEYLKEKREAPFNDDEPLAEVEIIQKMIETDTIIELQFYPDTPIGSYKIYHYDIAMLLDEALSVLSPAA